MEVARYLELYKSYKYENNGYTKKILDFVTVLRSINKTDVVSIISTFSSIKNAVNTRLKEVAIVGE